MDLTSYLQERKSLIEAELTRSLKDSEIPKTLRQAMTYSLEAGGKRLRPILTLAGAEAVGGSLENVLPIAVALEMIHTFSLIHDDLPAMDDDDLRRGKPTNHKVFGEAVAILAGDALLAEAFLMMTKRKESMPADRFMEVIHDIAIASGARGMTGGQVIDMEATGHEISEQSVEAIHRHKTGKLLTVSVVVGAKLSGASSLHLNALQKYGEAIGLAFQIADDILDLEGTEEEIGKDVRSDVSNAKATYPSIFGLEGARAKAKKLVDDAIGALETFDERAEPLRLLAHYIIERRK